MLEVKNGCEAMEDRISLLLSTRGIVDDLSNSGSNSSIFCLFDGRFWISELSKGHGGDGCVDYINNKFISTLVEI